MAFTLTPIPCPRCGSQLGPPKLAPCSGCGLDLTSQDALPELNRLAKATAIQAGQTAAAIAQPILRLFIMLAISLVLNVVIGCTLIFVLLR